MESAFAEAVRGGHARQVGSGPHGESAVEKNIHSQDMEFLNGKNGRTMVEKWWKNGGLMRMNDD